VNGKNLEDFSNFSMLDLFRIEAENQTALLTSTLLEIEKASATPAQLESLMRAAHSLKGAARIVNLQPITRLAHAMEDCFVAAQRHQIVLRQKEIDVLLKAVDLLGTASRHPSADASRLDQDLVQIDEMLGALRKLTETSASQREKPAAAQSPSSSHLPPAQSTSPQQTPTGAPPSSPAQKTEPEPAKPNPPENPYPQAAELWPAAQAEAQSSQKVALATSHDTSLIRKQDQEERVVRLTAENLNRLLGLAGESLVESRWLRPFSDSLQRLKRQQTALSEKVDLLRQTLQEEEISERAQSQVTDLVQAVTDSQHFLNGRIEDLDLYDRRSAHLSHRLYLEVLRTRMRPFADGARRFPRMVRDVARSLGKAVRLEVLGENTQVDRDILERLETPLAHLLRNAVDHGCETAEERTSLGKPPEAVVRLEARHSAGMLVVTVSDDGAGVDLERVRRVIVDRKLTTPEIAEKLSETELLQFLFLPGFTVKTEVTEISGRGVGLDIVQNMVKSVRGAIRLHMQPGRGLRVQLHLPLTMSVLRALLVEISGEPYAVPLSQIARVLKLSTAQIEALEGRHYFVLGDQQVGLLSAHQVLDSGDSDLRGNELPVVVLGDRGSRYGLIVDNFLGERELVVQPLDPRLGKIKDISAAALMEDGAPVLILDVDDVIRSVEKLISGGMLAKVNRAAMAAPAKKPKRVLAVDDSLTVRELERKLLTSRGYLADVAVDGMDGWNAARTGDYDLIITDVDMPRMDGIELATLIKRDPQLKSLPVMIVSYKDHEHDRMRGLQAGADYYLTKGSFHDETLIQAVIDLIGEPDA
jgi:two-component system, chemotaxis family, sensor histidine kinase and response regulator WspE